MKYSDANKPLACMQTQSTCYKGTRTMEVLGVLWHSTGANNPWLKRYVQPSDNDPNRAYLLNLLGKNAYGNDWNHVSRQAGLNCWVGKLADGTVTTIQTMPWSFRPWGCGSGAKGSCNTGWIQFEICEDDLSNRDYFEKCYQEACEITAYLCKLYNIDPKEMVTFNGMKVPTILCHYDSYKLGMGCNHSDVYPWFNKYGKTMDSVREDVAKLLQEDDEMLTYDQFKDYMKQYRKELQDNDSGEWSQKARQFCVESGIFSGAGTDAFGNLNYMWEDLLTREQCAQVLYTFAQKFGLANS